MDLSSDRLFYYQFQESEYEEYASWYCNDLVMKNITGKGLTEQETSERFLKSLAINKKYPGMGFFAVREKQNRQFVGIAKLVFLQETLVEIGYGFLPEYWGKGYASELLQFFISYGHKSLFINQFLAIVNTENSASKRVLDKHGFLLHHNGIEGGKAVDFYNLDIPE